MSLRRLSVASAWLLVALAPARAEVVVVAGLVR